MRVLHRFRRFGDMHPGAAPAKKVAMQFADGDAVPRTVTEKRRKPAPQRYARSAWSAGESAENASLLAMYGSTLRARHFQCLKRLSQSMSLKDGELSSLTVFHLVEMGLLARDQRGVMRITPVGECLLADYERVAYGS